MHLTYAIQTQQCSTLKDRRSRITGQADGKRWEVKCVNWTKIEGI